MRNDRSNKMKRRNLSQRSEMLYDLHSFGIVMDSREIFLSSSLDYSYEEAELDHWAANNFIRNLTTLNNLGDGTILIHQITGGGDWNYGMAIYDAIKASPSPTVLLAYAHARSMSSIIPQAATWRVMMPSADFLMHWGFFGVEGSHRSCMEEADWARKTEDVMLDIYVGRCVGAKHWQDRWKTKHEERVKKELREWMDKKGEVYFSASESVQLGFMDGVLGEEGYETISNLRE